MRLKEIASAEASYGCVPPRLQARALKEQGAALVSSSVEDREGRCGVMRVPTPVRLMHTCISGDHTQILQIACQLCDLSVAAVKLQRAMETCRMEVQTDKVKTHTDTTLACTHDIACACIYTLGMRLTASQHCWLVLGTV